MTSSGYFNSGAIDTDVEIDSSKVAGKTAIVTGGILNSSSLKYQNEYSPNSSGANGIGEAYTRALVKAG